MRIGPLSPAGARCSALRVTGDSGPFVAVIAPGRIRAICRSTMPCRVSGHAEKRALTSHLEYGRDCQSMSHIYSLAEDTANVVTCALPPTS